MKYLFLLLVLGLGYEGYTNWPEIKARYEQVQSHVVAATAAVKTQSATNTPPPGQTGATVPIPGQVAAPVPGPVAAPAAPAVPLGVRVAESQKAAVAKYPSLGQVNSEMNSRFVFRYKRMVAEKSPRLQEPTWPLQLADEVAVASGIKPNAVASSGGGAAAVPLVTHQAAAR